MDGVETGTTVDTGDYEIHHVTLLVPPSAYQEDGSFQTSIVRTNASSGAMVNEIALEEETLNQTTCYALNTQVSPSSSGNITINTDPNCPGEPDKYLNGTEVSLTASANTGYQFTSWGGDASGTDLSTTVILTEDRNVTANF